jgi:nitrate reductase beta subunit
MTAFEVMDDKFHLRRQPTDSNGAAAPADKGLRINLLNWDGKSTNGLFPAQTNGAGNGAAADPAPVVESAS